MTDYVLAAVAAFVAVTIAFVSTLAVPGKDRNQGHHFSTALSLGAYMLMIWVDMILVQRQDHVSSIPLAIACVLVHINIFVPQIYSSVDGAGRVDLVVSPALADGRRFIQPLPRVVPPKPVQYQSEHNKFIQTLRQVVASSVDQNVERQRSTDADRITQLIGQILECATTVAVESVPIPSLLDSDPNFQSLVRLVAPLVSKMTESKAPVPPPSEPAPVPPALCRNCPSCVREVAAPAPAAI